MNGLVTGGAVLAVLGLPGFAIPIFTTQQTKERRISAISSCRPPESTSYVIAPIVPGGAVVVGFVLIGAGLYRRR